MMMLLLLLLLALALLGFKLLSGMRLRDIVSPRLALLCRWRGHSRSRSRVTKVGDMYLSRCRFCAVRMEREIVGGQWHAIGAGSGIDSGAEPGTAAS